MPHAAETTNRWHENDYGDRSGVRSGPTEHAGVHLLSHSSQCTSGTPLWNRAVGFQNYELYSSTTLSVPLPSLMAPQWLCLSCHDGTIALGAVLQPSGGIAMTGQITPGFRESFKHRGKALILWRPPFFLLLFTRHSLVNHSILSAQGVVFYGGQTSIIECFNLP